MLGAIIGDVVGSIYEFNNIKTTDFPLFSKDSMFTDDSLMSIAVAMWLLDTDHSSAELERIILDVANRYPNPMGGYGGRFAQWVHSDNPQAYGSYGNGSAMRCSSA